MRIAIVGTGAIGSVFAYQLARAGHEVTVVARGRRLEQLRLDQAIVLTSGERAPVEVHAELDESQPYDLVLVTVLATQVEPLLPRLAASAAGKVMFMFNTFEALDRLRDAVGPDRFVFGFPGGVFCLLVDGRIQKQIRTGTTTDDSGWATIFSESGIPTVVESDMQSWLRSHAALVVPLMAIGVLVVQRGAGISWRETKTYAQASEAGFEIVEGLGHALVPSSVRSMRRMPRLLVRVSFWAFSRTKMLRDLGKLGPSEPRMLIDMMAAVAPERAGSLLAIRP